MLAIVGTHDRFVATGMCLRNPIKDKSIARQKLSAEPSQQTEVDPYCPLIPGLPEDIAKLCIALVPRHSLPAMGSVSKRWRSFIKSKEFLAVRWEAGSVEEWIYVLTSNSNGDGSHWEVLGTPGCQPVVLPPMPGPEKAGFGVVVVDGNLLVVAGYSVDGGKNCVSDDVYEYDSRLNKWCTLAKMNVARHDFACAEVSGIIYAVGGFGLDGDSLSSAEAYDPVSKRWVLVENLRRPRWGCFGCSFEGKLYVMGGRSSFTIGNSRFVEIYNPDQRSWGEIKNGCVMVTAHAVLGERLFCIEWKDQRKLAVFNPTDNSWHSVSVPLTGSSSTCFCFGVTEGKLLLFSKEEETGYNTLQYDPNAPAGSEWEISSLKPSGQCLCSVTIKT